MSSISISPVVKLFAVILPVLSNSLRVTVPLTVRSFVITTLLVGTKIVPVPFARSSKLLFDAVVVIKLSSILMSSKLAIPVTDNIPVMVALFALNPLVDCTFAKLVVPLICKSFVITTLSFGITTLPVPFALSSKSLLDNVVVIMLSLI